LAVVASWSLAQIAHAQPGLMSFSQLLQAQGLLMTAQPIVQFNGAVIQAPLKRPRSRQSNLTMVVDSRWGNGYGYRPIVVTFSSATPAASDRLIKLRLSGGWGGQTTVEQDVLLAAGNSTATATLLMPHYQVGMNFYWWDVWVDGVKDKDLSIEPGDAANRTGGGVSSGSAGTPTFLVMGPPQNDKQLVTTGSLEFEVLTLSAATFPRRWLEYTCIDVVALSADELQALPQTNHAAYAALRSWIFAGGSLWVCEVGEKLEQISDVSKVLGLKDSVVGAELDDEHPAPVSAEADPGGPAWRPARFRRGNIEGRVVTFQNLTTGRSHEERDPDVIRRLRSDANFTVTEERFEELSRQPPELRRRADTRRWFVEQPLGLGVVRAFRGANEVALISQLPAVNPNAGSQPAPEQLPPGLASALRSTRTWRSRHGVAPDEANMEFATLLVPGVGLAPVMEFRVLITLFVLVIGPLNYWLLKRFHRRHLLVVTVPLAALVTTAALFGYAITADGFSTSVRAYSITKLDQRTGDATCWTRLSYYAGMAPGDGLTMPADLAIYPIVPSWRGEDDFTADREVLASAEQTRLTKGWLLSRTPTQYLTVRARKSTHRIELLTSGEKLRATNQLGTPIRFLLVVEDKGKLFLGENLPVGARTLLQPIARNDAIRRVREVVMESEPEVPPALAGSDDVIVRSRRYGYGSNFNQERLHENAAAAALADLAGLTGRPALDLPARSYIAVTETGPEVAIGVPSAAESGSFHAIIGKW
jgi:hypothetical protein